MTKTRASVPRFQRWLNVRTLLLLLFIAAAGYAGVLPVYLFFRIGAAAGTLAQGTQAVVSATDDVMRRSEAVYRAHEMMLRLLRAAPADAPTPAALDSLQAMVAQVRTPPDRAIAQVPEDLRQEIVRANAQLSAIAALLDETGALWRHGGRSAVRQRLAEVDSLRHGAAHHVLLVAQLGREDLVAREASVGTAMAAVRRDLLLWLVIGMLLAVLGVFAIRRRVLRPLSALEAGLARVSEGDLNTQLPISRMDEAGRLAAHFNEMTRVLRNRAEEQGRFAAAGELLAGVAHEVNNPLMAIAAHAENRVADPTITPEQRDEMQQVLRQAQRATKLLRGLLRFVRATERRVASVNLNDVVRGALDLVSYRFGVDEITVGGKLDGELPAVQGDAIRLEQVLVNLLSNAIDALRAVKPPRRLTVDTWVENGSVSVAVGDNGPGVAPDVAARLFRPFATTKGRRGTGLGLYISRQIAREAEGELVLAAAELGGGARFVMTLPAASVPDGRRSGGHQVAPVPAPLPEVAPRTPQPRLKGVRVLIVDDEEPVRKPMAKFLKRRGAEVTEAGDGVDAMRWLESQQADVIVADLRMPRMSGTELFAALESQRPELAARVLFLSGDVSQLAEPGSTPVPRERVLVKPVELHQLEQRIAEIAAR